MSSPAKRQSPRKCYSPEKSSTKGRSLAKSPTKLCSSPSRSRSPSKISHESTSRQQSPNTPLKELFSKLPCRTQETETLFSIFKQPQHIALQSIFIHGHSSTGKTHVLQTFMAELNIRHVWINCVVVYNQRLLFEAILKQLLSKDKSNAGSFSCENMCDFLFHLKNIVQSRELDSSAVYIVFDKAEKLCEMSPTVLASLLRLQELTQLNICVILISENSWDKFNFGTYFCQPFLLHFPQYKKEEIVEILLLDCPESISTELFQRYLQTVMNVFYMVTHNLQELRYIALSHLEKYCEPIKAGEVEEHEQRKLWRFIEPHYRNALKSVYLRESRVPCSFSNERTAITQNVDEAELRATVELPFFSKFLLLASYIASYNPQKADKQMFLKNSGRMRKKVPRAGSKRVISQHDKGSNAFTLQRMIAIFYSIIEEEPKPSTYLLSQVSTLVSLHLLLLLNNDISCPKYKCMVSLEFIKNIGKTVKFEITEYLCDFL